MMPLLGWLYPQPVSPTFRDRRLPNRHSEAHSGDRTFENPKLMACPRWQNLSRNIPACFPTNNTGRRIINEIESGEGFSIGAPIQFRLSCQRFEKSRGPL